jgi:hypothetical protein
MTRTTLRTGLVLLTAGIGASLGYVAPADAAYPAVLQLAPGFGGPKEKDGGAGNEQIDVTTFIKDGKQYLVSIYMSSNVEEKDSPWQCKCTSTLMDSIIGPTIVKDQVQLTHNGGERPCNHPRIASNGADYGVWTYGTNEANGNTRTFVQAINEKCELMSDRLRISEDNNQNEGAPDIVFNSDGYFTAGYLSTANNDKDAMYTVGVKLDASAGAATVAKMWHTQTVAPSNIGRPAIVQAGPKLSFACAAQGNERPPEDGVACALVDSMTGEVLHKELIAKSDKAAGIYYNQPTVANLGDNVFAVQVLESNGTGNKKDIKGHNISHLYAYKVSAGSFLQQGYVNNIGKFATHSAICGGTYGEKGAMHVAVVGASPTGLGQPSIQFVGFNTAAFTVNPELDNWTMGFVGDAGKIANLYGHNPNTQGRDFLRCLGNVKNPGYGIKNGYQADVETFFVAPHAGNIPGEPKNAGFVSFIPGKVGVAAVPEAPKEQPKQGIAPPVDEGTGDTGGGETTGETTGDTGGETDTKDPSIVNGPTAGACAVSKSGSSSPAGLAFLAIGVGALLAARRRR